MKKIMYVLGLGLLSSSLFAACFGPFCYDDTGATVAGKKVGSNGNGMPTLGGGAILALTPTIGDVVVCSSCSNATGGYALCLATGSTINSFIITGSTNGVVACK